METKKLVFGEDSRKKMLAGACKVNDAVKVTLGARGRTVVIGHKNSKPTVTLDGITIAKAIKLEDSIEDLGAELVVEASNSANEVAGDGSTTTIILSTAMMVEGLKAVSAGHNPMGLKRGIDKAVETVVEELKKEAKEISSKEEIVQIASISANNDSVLGNVIADAIERVGKNGVVTVEESKSFETYVDYVEGMSIDRGYISPYFATNRDTMNTILDNPYILLLDRAVNSMQEILPILEKCKGSGRPLLIVTDDLNGDSLNSLVINVVRGALQVCAIKPPKFGDLRKLVMEDIAILTGRKVISTELGTNIKLTKLEDLGKSQKNIDRLSKLSCGIAILNVGATTEV